MKSDLGICSFWWEEREGVLLQEAGKTEYMESEGLSLYIYIYLYVVGLGLGLVGIGKHLVLLLKMDNFLGSLRMKFSRNGNGDGAF